MQRKDKRRNNQLRDISIIPDFNVHAEGSAFVKFGNTHVICNATVEKATPRWMQNDKRGWVTAEYGMLPRSTNERMNREANRGKQSGRTMEIQRLIGRSLRQAVDLEKLMGYTITVDCDVIQADGGTRTASITGATVALHKALKRIKKENAINNLVAAVSVGICEDELLLDLDYEEDSAAEVDANFVFTSDFELIEVQSTGEEQTFKVEDLNQMLDLVRINSQKVFEAQKKAIT